MFVLYWPAQRLKIAFLPVILFSSRMERNPQRGRIQRAAELSHIQGLVIVDWNDVLSRIDGFADGIGQLVWQPTVRNQWPAAEIDGLNVWPNFGNLSCGSTALWKPNRSSCRKIFGSRGSTSNP